MDQSEPEPPGVVDLVSAVQSLQDSRSYGPRIAIEGPSGAGKTSFAFRLAAHFQGAFVVQTDTFHLPLSAALRLRPRFGELGAMIDWRRYRETVLLRQSREQRVRLDWVHPVTGKLSAEHDIDPRSVLICDGTFSARQELRDQYDFLIFVDADTSVRRKRIADRDQAMGPEWHRYIIDVWNTDEDEYMMWARQESYDLRVDTTSS